MPTASGSTTNAPLASLYAITASVGGVAVLLNSSTAARTVSPRPLSLYVAASLSLSSWAFSISMGHAHAFAEACMASVAARPSSLMPASAADSLSEKPWPSTFST